MATLKRHNEGIRESDPMAASSYFDASNPTGPEKDGEVRLLFVEHSPDYAALVCETLDRAAHGHFEVSHADRLDAAERDIAVGHYDALLLDLTGSDSSDGRSVTIDAASEIATRLPVILLTGSDEEHASPGQADEASAIREGIAHSPLPDAILGAVRRHRRIGQQGASEPIVLRDPLRAFARVFAKLRRSLAR